jgi:hypothetical protein
MSALALGPTHLLGKPAWAAEPIQGGGRGRRRPEHQAGMLQGKQLGDKPYKVHLDGYDQTPLLTG